MKARSEQTQPVQKTPEQVMHDRGYELVPCRIVDAATGKVTMSSRWAKKGEFRWL